MGTTRANRRPPEINFPSKRFRFPADRRQRPPKKTYHRPRNTRNNWNNSARYERIASGLFASRSFVTRIWIGRVLVWFWQRTIFIRRWGPSSPPVFDRFRAFENADRSEFLCPATRLISLRPAFVIIRQYRHLVSSTNITHILGIN